MTGNEGVLRGRVAAVLSVLFLLLLTPVAAHAVSDFRGPGPAPMGTSGGDEQVLFGSITDPDGEGLADSGLTLEQDDAEFGTPPTNSDGEWEIPVPEPGTYDVVLDLETLPADLQPQQETGERREGVLVRPGRLQTRVPFPLISTDERQEPPPGAEPTEEPEEAPTTDDAPAPAEEGAIATEQPRGASFGARFAQLTVEGIKLGAIIAITAVGLSLVFGTTRLINFAHGEFVTIGAVTAFFLSTSPGNLPLILAAALAMMVVALLAGGLEKAVWLPMRRRGTGLIQLFIISIGLSLLLRYLMLVLFGSRRGSYSDYNV